MLSSVKLILEPVREEKCHTNMASLFHGLLMEIIDHNYAEHLHESGLKPFSQYLGSEKDGKFWHWTVNFLTEQAWQEIGKPLLNDNLTEFVLKDKELRLAIRNKKVEQLVSYRELTERFYLNETPQRNIRISFLTPCSFKSANQYVIFPELFLIYQSLINKYDSFAEEFSVKSGEALQHLAKYTRIRGYNLRSTHYHLAGVKIPSFIGKLDLTISGPETMVSLANLLFRFGEWSGIGIKTALGMGAVRIE